MNPRCFLLLDHCGWVMEDLRIFLQPFNTWQTSEKFREFCRIVNGELGVSLPMAFTNDCAERIIHLLQLRISTVRSEGRLQSCIVAVEELRRRCKDFKANNFNNKKLQTAVRNMLQLNR
jgi:hypothetical protein